MAEMKGAKTESIKVMTKAEEAEFKLEMEEFVAENTAGKTAVEKEGWTAGWLHAKKIGLVPGAEADGWHLCGQGCKDLRDAKKRSLDADMEKAQDEAFAIMRAKKNPPLNETVPHSQMLVIQGNCSSSSSGVVCCEECARAASG